MPDRFVDESLNRRVAARLRMRRDQLGLSAAELQRLTGVSRSTIANFEGARTGLNIDAYFALVTALAMKPDVFMREVVCKSCGSMPPPGYSCSACGAGNEGDPCMACRGQIPAGFICRACGRASVEEDGSDA